MSNAESQRKVIALKPPLPEELIHGLLEFWSNLFQTDYEPFRGILTGEECGHNRDVIYLLKKDAGIVGTCHLTVAESNPALGGLGEVGTAPDFRGSGIASELCERARDDFQNTGGQALFLGTNNPAAARVYRRLGWRKLPGTNVMVFVANGHTSDAYLDDYFSGNGSTTVSAGSAADRIPIIPLIVSPHDWQVMDANTDIRSTRYVEQNSCMGLYTRYAPLTQNGLGAWFAARTGQQRTVALSTACLDGRGGCQVDGFMHANFSADWEHLLQSCVSWASDQGAQSCWARVSAVDKDKMSCFEAIGFQKVGEDASFDLCGKQIKSIRLKRRL